MKTTVKKDFDAVRIMCQIRDKISQDFADMDYYQIKDYFVKRRSKERIMPSH